MKRTGIKKARSKPRPGRLKGADMVMLRSECYVRDRGLCQECFFPTWDDLPDWHDAKYHMAHIKAKRIGGDTLDNVRTLCGKCHRDEHSGTVNGRIIHVKVRPHGNA